MANPTNSFGTRSSLKTPDGALTYYDLGRLADAGHGDLNRLPFCIRILLENLLRNEDGLLIGPEDITAMAGWSPVSEARREVPFMPARILLQDFTGVPSVVDLAAMREAAKKLFGDPARINPIIPAELVIDHSVQVDHFGTPEAFDQNEDRDYGRNAERYAFLRWGQQSFKNFSVVPPATGICHQVNLEYLARVVFTKETAAGPVAFPDTLVGLDSHTTMINGLGVMGWGVGGIEAEAVMLGRPYYLLTPQVVGFKLNGRLPEAATATDLVLTVTQILRKKGVVGKFVEFFGPGLSTLSLEDRATIANMSPEYGATMGFFPVDDKTLAYLRLTGRPEAAVSLVERYCKTQGLFHTEGAPDPLFTDTVELDMATVEPCLAGPKRPQDRIVLARMKPEFLEDYPEKKKVAIDLDGETVELGNGSVVIAAITSCTNTSNPSVLMGAGLLAKKAVEKGLSVPPWVKTSLAPGSKVVIDYLRASGLLSYLEKLKFHHVAYGCTTCIGNSGPLPQAVARAVEENDLVVASVLSGNRNFEGRINPLTRANFLASPPLVVAYALAGRVDIDFETEPIGTGTDGQAVYLRELWPDKAEIKTLVQRHVSADMYREDYATVFEGTARWKGLPVPEGERYAWRTDSTYIKEPPFFEDLSLDIPPLQGIVGARVLALLGDSVTTDHISPAGAIAAESPAGRYLQELGVTPDQFNSYGSRRGNHEVMMRGTFANIRLSNLLVPGVSGGVTRLMPENRQTSIYDASMAYQAQGTPLVVLAGREYGTGSSRDWAAKGTVLLGVRAVIAAGFERIHRSNLVCMGVLPLEFLPGDTHESLGLSGEETYDIDGIDSLAPAGRLKVTARSENGARQFEVLARIDSPVELEYYRHGGILNFVLRQMAQ
ncbi:MAG: aconitate hydratase AcnA [Desulfobacterales bacterium]|nr:aconitate hydratase AcnA [Desulfobacterales bacterium]